MFELVKVLISLMTLAVIVKVSKRNLIYLNFVLYALWLRFTLGAFHQYTIDPFVMGLSINALFSIAVAGIGILLLPKRIFLLKRLFFLYIFVGAIIVSGLLNVELVALTSVIIKWLYFVVLSISIFLCIRKIGLSTTLKYLLLPFLLPISLQVLSILLGEFKATERDGSVSYIGGYNHEAGFSMIILSACFILAFIEKSRLQFRGLYFFSLIGLLILVNYRTAILAILPLILVFTFAYTEKFSNQYRIVVSAFFVVIVGGFFLLLWVLMSERFADVTIVLRNWQDLIKEPQYFAGYERALLSSRVFIWSQYVTEYLQAPAENLLVGFGPEAWQNSFNLYAHNTYVSFLYEYGLIGLVSFLLFLVSLFRYTFKISDFYQRVKFFAAFIGFLVLNLATMPIWNIEGLIIFAILFSCILSSDARQGPSKIKSV